MGEVTLEMLSALNHEHVGHRLDMDGDIVFFSEEEKAKGEEIIARVKAGTYKTIHELITLTKDYEAVLRGIKTFEVRKNDRLYKVGDTLKLREWDGSKYTGREQDREIAYILSDPEYCKLGYVILAFDMFMF